MRPLRPTAFLLASSLAAAWPACTADESAPDEAEVTAGAEEEVTPHYPGPCTVQVDYEIDGSVDEVERFAYDASGNVVREENDTNGDGTVDAIIVHTYDEEGHRIRSESDRDADGTVDASTVYVFEEGRLVREETDRDGDGTPEAVLTTTYDEQGRPVREEIDETGNGRADVVREYTYDEATGLLAQRQQGYERRTYEYGEDGRVAREVISSRTRRRVRYRVQSVVVYEYDAEGRRTLEEYQTPRGEVATSNRYAYDEHGSLVRLESDMDVTTSTFTYDEAANPLREEVDEVGEKSLRIYGYEGCF